MRAMQARRDAGFGLAEVMVAVAIGLITTLVITQVMINFDGRKRETTGAADAQLNGSIALYSIQRRLQSAGYGLPVYSAQNQPLACDPVAFDNDDDPATADVTVDLFPVRIVDGLNGTSDRITLRWGPTQMGGIPIGVTSVAGNAVGIDNNMMCAVGDVALAMNGASCQMSRVRELDGTTQVVLADAGGIALGSSFTCLGNWSETTYQVAGSTLLENGVPVAAGVVSLQAQYGVSDAPSSNQVTAWVDASGDWAIPAPADRNRIRAVRVAVVARAEQLEAANVTQACSSLTEAGPTGLCAWEGTDDSPAPDLDLSATPSWQRYRYRVFETIVPLRNMIWSSDTL
ncbi:MAG TPA: PilW family protein [Noviherbaspirillum sp.]|nr:PilW family protein [Noviherbaspirillum sp.]